MSILLLAHVYTALVGIGVCNGNILKNLVYGSMESKKRMRVVKVVEETRIVVKIGIF